MAYPPENYRPGLPGSGIIYRGGIVRLGWGFDAQGNQLPEPVGPELYYPGIHGAVGIRGVRSEDGILVVTTDFRRTERIVSAGAFVDLQLARKGVVAGLSGGGSVSRFAITATRPIPRNYRVPDGPKYAPGELLRPSGAWANPFLDNLWLLFISFDTAAAP
jgi:hypothetical protein